LRVHPRLGGTFDGLANIEFALRRSRIVARKHGVDRAKDHPYAVIMRVFDGWARGSSAIQGQ
jgi:hypothetical protein